MYKEIPKYRVKAIISAKSHDSLLDNYRHYDR
jgi:hypothetical protein